MTGAVAATRMQRRSRRTEGRTRILAAARAVVERGDSLTTLALSDELGVSQGYYARYFPSIEKIAAAVADDLLTDVLAEIDQAVAAVVAAGGDTRAQLDAAWHSFAQLVTERPGVALLLLSRPTHAEQLIAVVGEYVASQDE